jgi:hypothetical protein
MKIDFQPCLKVYLFLPEQLLQRFRDFFDMRALFASSDRSRHFCEEIPRHDFEANPKPGRD